MSYLVDVTLNLSLFAVLVPATPADKRPSRPHNASRVKTSLVALKLLHGVFSIVGGKRCDIHESETCHNLRWDKIYAF